MLTDAEKEEKFSSSELAAHRAAAARGEIPSIEIVRKFVLSIRKKFTASPVAVEKGKTTRNAKPKVTEDQIDFF